MSRLRWSGALALGLLVAAPDGLGARAQVAEVPALSNGEFGALVATLSELDGVFAVSGLSFSDNVVSNEYLLQYFAPQLAIADLAGRVYIGVGPEQNFTYIAATDPAVAFIVDIRRENRDVHLFYKALFELSADRAAFLSRLFSRSLAAGVMDEGLDAVLDRLDRMPPSPERLSAGAREVSEQLTVVRGLELSGAEAQNIRRLHEQFATLGPGVHYGSDGRSDGPPVWLPTLREMLAAVDRDGNPWSFLADEERYRRVRNLHLRNLIVPVVRSTGCVPTPAGSDDDRVTAPRRGAALWRHEPMGQANAPRPSRQGTRSAIVALRMVLIKGSSAPARPAA